MYHFFNVILFSHDFYRVFQTSRHCILCEQQQEKENTTQAMWSMH